MRLIQDLILRNVNGKTVLVPLSDCETDFQGMIALNHTGAFVCEKLRQDTGKDDLIAALSAEYGLSPEQATADLDAFLSELDACHLLVH